MQTISLHRRHLQESLRSREQLGLHSGRQHDDVAATAGFQEIFEALEANGVGIPDSPEA